MKKSVIHWDTVSAVLPKTSRTCRKRNNQPYNYLYSDIPVLLALNTMLSLLNLTTIGLISQHATLKFDSNATVYGLEGGSELMIL